MLSFYTADSEEDDSGKFMTLKKKRMCCCSRACHSPPQRRWCTRRACLRPAHPSSPTRPPSSSRCVNLIPSAVAHIAQTRPAPDVPERPAHTVSEKTKVAPANTMAVKLNVYVAADCTAATRRCGRPARDDGAQARASTTQGARSYFSCSNSRRCQPAVTPLVSPAAPAAAKAEDDDSARFGGIMRSG